jgi:sterol desaturase/sphingolipid hydroxylase (fatty acid hydroxylase superfamily)
MTPTSQPKLKTKGTASLFDSKLLEQLTRTHVSVPVTIFCVYGAGLLLWSIQRTDIRPVATAGLFLAGLFVFTWVEYMVHRFLFHLPTTTAIRKRFQYMMHGVHHEYPRDKDRLAMPPVLSVAISTLLLVLSRLVLGDYSFSLLAGFLVGYAAYLSVHYVVHVYAPPKNFLRTIWKNHVIHHYKDGEVAFGVTSSLWDYVYGTMQRQKPASSEDSESQRKDTKQIQP